MLDLNPQTGELVSSVAAPTRSIISPVPNRSDSSSRSGSDGQPPRPPPYSRTQPPTPSLSGMRTPKVAAGTLPRRWGSPTT